ncbi:diguanylate cyclase (GGDEF)-like protein/PAS domain S-box-containing protein [Pseudorhizobium tarimense]|uniref:Diguanylate cyclase (GGDEF)-like protein/PAS domain S-box-containing protein n=1 Tax=Pseudorhizobium tarimense TaxID=1079109 RepID=A0ABV2H340_9HYPH|nr:bifunctional diguanylate cyclase/phosphodiesterase [Pseudorhizobium tarimense]MCJ8518087.1 EAL domain-containing protein [Pseudorhizobium tarimense]
MGEQISSLPLPLAIVTACGQTLETNAAFKDLWAEPGLDACLFSTLSKEDRRQLIADIAAAAQGVSCETRELLIVSRQEPRWAQVKVMPLPDGGAAGAALVMCLDSPNRMRGLQELVYRESRWDHALISSDLGVWDHNWGTGRKYYSPTWHKMRGLEPGDPLPASTAEWLQKVHPDDREKVVHAMDRQAAGDPAFAVFDYRERHKDGHWVWIECRGAGVEWDASGKATRVVGTDTDVTVRKASEEAAARIARRLEMALEISGIGVFEADFTTGQSEWDEKMFSIYGFDDNRSIEIGGLWESLVHPEDLPRVLQKVADHASSTETFSDEYRVLRNGEERIIRSHSKRFTDQDGHAKLVGANWDVTEDVMLRRELEHATRLAEAKTAALEAARQEIEHSALHDYLTNLPNRRYLDLTLRRMAGLFSRDAQTLSILHLDLDRFKNINDTLGHATGDALLKHVADVLASSARENDFVARVGGDEFVIIHRAEGSSSTASELARELIARLAKPITVDGHVCRTGASIGIACQTGEETDVTQLLLNADIALYRAKKSGRNRFEFFTPQSYQELVSRKRIADEVLAGLEQRAFVPFYQLQFDATSLDVVGVEALARLMTPDGRLHSPDVFLPVANELGVVADIDAMILDAALSDFRLWQQMGLGIPKFSVNVSYERLYDPALTEKLEALDIEPGVLAFELLESIFLDSCDEQVLMRLAQLRQLGISLEIDDFGTGHASIVSLLKVCPKALKVDRELVAGATRSSEQQALLRSIVEIGRSLDICVVAEGVESDEDIAVLRSLGCDSLQGYGLAKPMPAPDLVAFIQRQHRRRR